MSKASVKASQAPAPGPKPLTITPQLIVALHQDGTMSIERIGSSPSPYRDKRTLTQENAYSILLDALSEKAGEIELERQLLAERNSAPKKLRTQPNWVLIAKHPQVEIRKILSVGGQLSSRKSELTLEEMDL